MTNVLERVATQTAGAIGAIRASVRGLYGVFSRLSEEHREIVVGLERVLGENSDAERVVEWNDVRNELLAHERAEQQQVFGQLVHYTELVDIVDTHRAEASELEVLVAEIDALAVNSSAWRSAIERLEQQLRRHSHEEEDQLFPRIQAVVGVQRTKELEGLYTNGRRSALHELKLPTDDDPSDGR